MSRVLWLVALSLSGCRSPLPPLEVEIAGCAEVTVSGECQVRPSSTLQLWLAGVVESGVEVRLDGQPLDYEDERQVQGGLHLSVKVDAGNLEIEAPKREPKRIRLPAFVADLQLVDVKSARENRDLDLAESLLLKVEMGRPGRLGQQARNFLARDRVEEAIASFDASIAENERLGLAQSAGWDRLAKAHTQITQGMGAESANETLDQVAAVAVLSAEVAADLAQKRAALAVETHDLSAGARWSREAMMRAERLGDEAIVVYARQELIFVLVLLGRWPEASLELAALEGSVDRVELCDRAEILANMGWYALVGHRRAPELFPRLTPVRLEQAEAIFSGNCPGPLQLYNARLNLGWVSLSLGDLDGARRWLGKARSEGERTGRARADALLLEGQIELATPSPIEAKSSFLRLLVEAERGSEKDYEWYGHVGLGQALEQLDQLPAAIDQYQAAIEALKALRALTSLGLGRDTMLYLHREGWNRLIAAQIAQGRARDAASTIRSERSFFLDEVAWHPADDPRSDALRRDLKAWRSSLDKALADEWRSPRNEKVTAANRAKGFQDASVDLIGRALALTTLAVPETPLPKSADSRLYIHDDGEGGWIIAEHEDSWQVGRWARPSRTSTAITMPPLDLLKGARHATIYAAPALAVENWQELLGGIAVIHASNWTGAPEPSGARTALLVGDSSGTLPAAVDEIARVGARLRDAGWDVRTLVGPHTGAEVEAAIESRPLTLLHYAGHARHRGADGLEAALLMSDGPTFDAARILALSRAPAWIVLAACDSGAIGSRAEASGVGLAEVFLLRGTRTVIAAIEPVSENAARALADGIYRDPRGDWRVTDAFLDLRSSPQAALVRGFRVFGQ